MFDMSWGEVMLIGGVALVVIGPKDLPKALRTVGQVTGKLKRMAGEFQAQFNEAMREAELDEVRKEVEGVGRSASSFNPVQTIRNEIKGAVEAAGTKPSSAALAAATAQLQADAAGVPDVSAAPAPEADAHHPSPMSLPEHDATVVTTAPATGIVPDAPLPAAEPVKEETGAAGSRA